MADFTPRRVALYSPDRARYYDGRTREEQGVGGGITARLSMVEALARLGHVVTAYVHCEAPLTHRGVQYQPIDATDRIDCDVLIAISTGGALTFAPLRRVQVQASLRIVWVQGVPKPADLEAVGADYVYVASHFLHGVCATRWKIPDERLFVCYNGIHQEYFEAVEADPPARDPFAIAYVGPPEKGLDACIGVLRRLRSADDRFHLDVFGGGLLWGRTTDPAPTEPGVTFKGMLGQRDLARALFGYEYCLALQAMEEGFGIAVQEAKRAGAIVLASAVGAFRELVADGSDGFLVAQPHESAGAQQEAADRILGLSEDPMRRDRMRRWGRATPWNWDRSAEAWTGHWEHVLRKGPRVSGVGAAANTAGPRRVVISGYYGHGNLGDEAILSVLVDQFEQALPGVVPLVLSGDPQRTQRQHGVDALGERDVAALTRTPSCDCFVLGGGGLFHDYHGVDETTLLTNRHWGLTACAAMPVLARLTNKPLAIIAAGVGPLRTEAGRRYTRLIFEQADTVSVRDDASRELLGAIGVDTDRVAVTADPAFLLRSADPDIVRSRLCRMRVPDTAPLVVVALRTWEMGVNGRNWEAAVAGALDRLVDARNVHVLFVPFQSQSDSRNDDDRAVALRVRSAMRHAAHATLADADLSPSLVQGIFAASDLVVAMRLHAAILAANAGTAFVALRYDDKVGHALARVGMEAFGTDLAAVTADGLFQRMEAAWTARGQIQRDLAARVPALRAAATTAIDAVAGLMPRGAAPAPVASPEWTVLFERARAALSSRAPDDHFRPARAVDRAVRSVARALIPTPWRRRLRDTWQQRVMSRAAFAFDRYRRARMQTYGAHLGGLRASGQPGLVSVVLPAHNGGEMMRESIDSILGQAYREFELIIVNDGSTDDTGAVADEYARLDARVRVIHQDNQLLPAALNRGFAGARGEFLTWTSCDNRMKPAALQQLVDCLRRHPRWDMTYGNIDMIGDDGQPLTKSPFYTSYQRPHGSAHVHLPSATSELNVLGNNFIGSAFLYRSRVAHLLGDYDRSRFGMEDYDYWMRLNALMTLRHTDIDEPLGDYRFHDASLTARARDLDLASKRMRLVVFDQFRRDLYLSPIVWVLGGQASELARALEQRARLAGHIVYDGAYPLRSLPAHWTPLVYVGSSGDAVSGEPTRHELPDNALTVLVASEDALSPEIDPEWDLAIALGSMTPPDPPAHDRSRRGWLVAPDIDQLFHAIDVRARSAAAQAVGDLAESPQTTTLTASVVICTYRASDRLRAAIDSVLAQDFPADAFELVLVNNNPTDAGLASFLAPYRARVTHVMCPVPGHSAAKNAGISAARGRYVCFLDDDAVADRQWLGHLCRAFDEHPETGVIGGPILLDVPSPRPPAVTGGWEHYWTHLLPRGSGYTEVHAWPAFPWGANWAARRSVLAEIGGFRTTIGRKRGDFAGGEELAAAALAQRLGHRIAMVSDAIVHHRVDPARFTFTDVRQTMVARHLVAHATRRELLMPGPSGIPSSLARLALHHVDPRVRSLPHLARDVLYRKIAQVQLLKVQWQDWRERRRPPAGESL